MHDRLERGLEPIALEPHHTHVLLVASLHGTVLGEVLVPVHGHVTPELQRQTITERLGDRLWEERLRTQFERAARGPSATAEPPAPEVSVVVCASEGSNVEPLLESLQQLDPPALKVIVGRERGLAEARGEVVAFLESDSVVDPAWLAGLGKHFVDPLVMAVVGYTASQPAERGVYDLFSLKPPRLAESNCFIRRTALGDETSFTQLYGRLIETGYRVVSASAHVVWRRAPLPKPKRVRVRRARGEAPAVEPASSSPARVVRDDDPRLSVAIASYNRRERLAEVLTALGAQSYPPDRYEVVVVLDGSTDGSAERARSLGVPYTLRVIEQENSGLAATRNRGGRESTQPVVVFLDDDIVPERGFLAAHASAHRTGAEPGVALGTCPPVDLGDNLLSMRMRHWWRDYYRRRSLPDHQWTYVDFGDGNVSFPREVLAGERWLGRAVRARKCPPPGLGARDSPARERRAVHRLPRRHWPAPLRPHARNSAAQPSRRGPQRRTARYQASRGPRAPLPGHRAPDGREQAVQPPRNGALAADDVTAAAPRPTGRPGG